MLWLHRIQQRLSITRNEAVTLLTLSALFGLGLVVRHVQQHARPIPPDAYQEADRLFEEMSSEMRAQSIQSRDSSHTIPADTEPPLSYRRKRPVGPLDLNLATTSELEQLPRIGPKTAQAIISFRQARGQFRTVDELDAVKGIGPKTLDLLRPHVYVSVQDSS
ncbi:MAG: helix-hairpin-helix domain-containing protein [Rhodothermales bacterium]